MANPAKSRLLTVLIRALLVISMVTGLMLDATATNMRPLHANGIVSEQASAMHVGTKRSCADHDKKNNQQCPQSCCVAICGFCSLATLSLLDSAAERDRIATVRVATTDARDTGIEVGFDPPPPRAFG